MNKTISIPHEFEDIIEACEQSRFGEQDRPYAPQRWRFLLTIKEFPKEKKQEVEKRILDFCQRFCKSCKYSREEYGKIQSDDSLSFHEQMRVIAEGRYTLFPLLHEPGTPVMVEYEVVEDYFD